jgi:hypothetical protein
MNMISNNIFCQFLISDGEYLQCVNCGLKIKTSNNSPILFPCSRSLHRSENENSPSFIKKIKNFASSVVDHVSAGMPSCSDEQIIKRHDICLNCEFFKDDTCQQCGCPLFRNKQFVSKLAWADQECPVGKWGKEV